MSPSKLLIKYCFYIILGVSTGSPSKTTKTSKITDDMDVDDVGETSTVTTGKHGTKRKNEDTEDESVGRKKVISCFFP